MTIGEINAWTNRLNSILTGPEEIREERLSAFVRDFREAHGEEPGAEEVLDNLLSWVG